MNKQYATSLKIALNLLRALKFVSWNAHWLSKGPNFYGDHLLFERIYVGDDDTESIDDLIDTLAEKMVYIKVDVNCPTAFEDTYVASIRTFMDHTDNLPQAVFNLVLECLRGLQYAYKTGQQSGDLSLGMDDFLMAASNHIETYGYLLQQRIDGWLR